jgi:hypothetical protein
MATINLRFAFEKETKGAVLQEISEDGKPVFAEHWQALHSQVGTARWEDSPDADRYHHDLTRRFSGSTSTHLRLWREGRKTQKVTDFPCLRLAFFSNRCLNLNRPFKTPLGFGPWQRESVCSRPDYSQSA